MEINERIKYLRKELLHLTLEQFGEKVGVKRSAVCSIENERRGVTDQMFRSICREFGVREEWLRTGDGDPFAPQTRNQELQTFMNRVLADEEESFRKRLIAALSKMNPSDWEVLEKIAIECTQNIEPLEGQLSVFPVNGYTQIYHNGNWEDYKKAD